jgi:amidase
MKATHGLVPYTGIFPTEHTVDHVGPMTSSVADNALLLEVVAGADGLDPRQYSPVVHDYTSFLDRGISEVRIGVLSEGFGQAASEPDVDAAVREAVDVLEGLGARVEDVSMPMHSLGVTAWAPVIVEGAYELIFHGDALGTGWRGLYVGSLGHAQSAWRGQANSFPPLLQLGALMAEYVIRNYGRHYYAKAQNLARRLRAEYDRMFEQIDLLLMPTNPMKAPPLPGPDATKAEQMYPGFDSVTNTAPFNITGHPAMSVPVAMSDGLPIGMQLVAKWHDEPAIYRAAAAFEAATDWTAR